MATSNPHFFRVVPKPPLESVGFEVKVLDHRDFATVVVEISDFVSLTFSPTLNEPGEGSITLDQDSPLWSRVMANGQPAVDLINEEYLWQVYEDGSLRFEWLGQSIDQTDLDESETRAVTISGPGGADVLRWAKILPPGFPALPPPLPVDIASSTPADTEKSVSASNSVPARGWEFPLKWSAMQMWHALFVAAQSRGTIKFVHPTFTAVKDSAHTAWEYVPTVDTAAKYSGYRPELGMDLLEFLNKCTGQNTDEHFAERAEWFMHPGFKLEARKTVGVDRSLNVRFYEGGIETTSVTRTREEIANYVVVRDSNGEFSLAADSASRAKWNQREKLEAGNANIVDDGSRRNAIAQNYLAQYKDEQAEWTVVVPYDQPGRRVFRDYGVGDWVGFSSHNPDGSNTVNRYRVLKVVVQVEDKVTVELTLQSLIQFRQLQLKRRLSDLINKIDNGYAALPGPQDSAALPSTSGPIVPVWDANKGAYAATSLAGSGYGSGVFIQDTDPGEAAKTGDFWYDTAYSPDLPEPATPEPPVPVVEQVPDSRGVVRENVPVTQIGFGL